MRKIILFVLLLSLPAIAQIEPGKTVKRGAISITPFFQGPVAIPVAGMNPPRPGMMILIETDTPDTTDFVVTLQVAGIDLATQTFHRESAGSTAAWFFCDPKTIQSVRIIEIRTISTQTF